MSNRKIPPFHLEKLKEDWQAVLNRNRQTPFSAFKVATALCRYMNHENDGLAFPGIATLVAETSLHRTTVIHALQWLERHGYLKVERRRVGKKNLVNRYRPLVPINAAGSSAATLLGSSAATLPEPLNEPLTQKDSKTLRAQDSALGRHFASRSNANRLAIFEKRLSKGQASEAETEEGIRICLEVFENNGPSDSLWQRAARLLAEVQP